MSRPLRSSSVYPHVVIAASLAASILACSSGEPSAEALTSAPLASCVQGGGAALTCEPPDNPDKIYLCHSTGSAPNRYVMIEVGANAAGNGHVVGQAHGRNQLPDLVPGTGGLNCNCQPLECTNLCAGAPDGTSCQDDPCNQVGACQAGVCVSQPKDCSGAGDACNVSLDTCADGVCLTAPKAAGTGCADADRCDGAELCDGAGTCVAGTPVEVSDGDACTIDACDPATGEPSHTAVSTDDGDACTIDTCDPATGETSHERAAIDDGDACTIDACDPATGVSHTAVSVDDGVDCTIDSCDPSLGIAHVAYGPSCFDGDPNSVDTCDLLLGCVHTCRSGTVWSTASSRCEDQCVGGVPECHPDATAVVSCEAQDCVCDPGYEGDGFTFCGDVDECQQGALCGPDSVCVNTAGSYRCDCQSGFTGVDGACVDIDECAAAGACAPGATCVNTAGGHVCIAPDSGVQAYDCTQDRNCGDCDSAVADDGTGTPGTGTPGTGECLACKPGFGLVPFRYNSGVEYKCTDVDECLGAEAPVATYEGVSAPQPLVCVNTWGGFEWQCQGGFTLEPQDAGLVCRDVDECAAGICGPNAPCRNTPGGYSCSCAEGYAYDGTGCADVDECARGTDACDLNATCVNSTGGYTCTCDAGSVGDGRTCRVSCDTGCGLPASCDATSGACECGDAAFGDGATCTACGAGFADCNGAIVDGCEADLNARTSCGACGDVCAAGEECVAGRCGVFTSTGIDGPFAPSGNVVLAPGVYDFTTIDIPAGVTVSTSGSGVLDLRATGAVVIDGDIDVSGGDGRNAIADNCDTARNGAGGNTGNRGIGLWYDGPANRWWAASGSGGSGFHHPTVQYHSWNTPSGPTTVYVGARYGGGKGARACPGADTSPYMSHGGGGYAGGGGNVPGATEQITPAMGTLGGDYQVRLASGLINACAPDDYSGCDGQWYSPSGPQGQGAGGGAIGPRARTDLAVRKTFRPGSGGGGGDAANTGNANGGGGGGGGGGGALRVASAVSITLGPSGRLLANGGAGGNGADGCGGAGGGGSGGVVYLHAPALTIAGDVEARGGAGGRGGVEPITSAVCGGNGGRGGLGRIRLSVDPTRCALAGDFDPPLQSGCDESSESGAPGFVYVKHGVTCADQVGLCQLDVSPCEDDPCANGSTCVDLVDSYRCDCPAGYTGVHCETDIDECASAPCVNGTCVDGVNRYTCECQEGWAGTNCERAEVCGNDIIDEGESCEGTWPDATAAGAICLSDCQRGLVTREVLAAGQLTTDAAIVAWYDVRLTMDGVTVPISDFEVSAKRTFPSPSSEVAGAVSDNGDGTYRVEFAFEEAGSYIDDWSVLDQPAHLVRYRFDAFPTTCGNGVVDHAFESCDSADASCFQCESLPFAPSLTSAVGSGFTDAMAGVPTLFSLLLYSEPGVLATSAAGCPFGVQITGTFNGTYIVPELLPQDPDTPYACTYLYTLTTWDIYVLDIKVGPTSIVGTPRQLTFL